MAEKVELFELDMDTSQAVKDIQRQQREVEKLKKEIDELTEAYGENSEAVIGRTAELKVAQKQLRDNKKITQDLIASQDAESGSIEQLRKQLAIVSKRWAQLSEEERENSDIGKQLSKQKLDLTDKLKKEEKATGDARRNVGNYTGGIEDAAQSLGVFGGSVGQAIPAVKSLGVAFKVALGPIGLIIGAIALVVKGLQAFFTSSEEGQNKLKRLQAIFKTVFGNLNDILSRIGEKIVSVFENPKEALKKLGTAIKNNIVNRFVGLIELIPNLGRAIGKLFKGEFKEAGKIAADAVAKVTLGVEDFTDKAVDGFNRAKDGLSDLIAEQQREIEIAQRLADREAALTKLRREQTVQLAKNKAEIQELILASRDETKSAEERRESILRANKIRQEELELNKQIALENYEIIKAQNELSNSTIEDKQREAEALANFYNVQAENSAQLRELKNRENELDRKIAAEEVARQKELMRLEKERADAAIAEFERQMERLRELQENEQQARALDLQNRFEIEQRNMFAILELEKERLRQQKEAELQNAEEIGANTLLIQKKYAEAEKEIERAKTEAKLSLAGDFAGNIAQIFGEQTKIGKAAAVAETTINTYKSATSAYSALAGIPVVGPGLGTAAAGAAIAAGLANVKKILGVDPTKAQAPSGLSTPRNATGGGATGGSQNINPGIGQGIASRQDIQTSAIRDSINNQEVQPILPVDQVTFEQRQSQAANEAANV